MGRIEAVKRTIILQLSLVGLFVQTILYIYVWQNIYNDIMQSGMWRSFHRKGFWLLAAVYFILLLFFSATYGGLKVGYGCVFFSGDLVAVYKYCLLLSDFPVVTRACHALSTFAYDAGADYCSCCLDFCQP